MITLGIHIGHDGGCAIAENGQILLAIAEERLVRHKYHNGWITSMFYCINHVNIKLDDIDLIVFSNAGDDFSIKRIKLLYNWGFPPKTQIIHCDHHLSHAIGAYSLCAFKDGMVFVGDAGGNNNDTESAYLFSSNHFEKIYKNQNRPKYKGLGTTYEAFTNLLGFSDQESGKVMALAAYGKSKNFNCDLFNISNEGFITSKLESDHIWGATDFVRKNKFNIDEKMLLNSKSDIAQDIASYIQDQFRETIITLLELLLVKHGVDKLILTGGIALNCSTNGAIRERNIAKDIFVSPIASDIGLPIGNAVYGFYYKSGIISKQNNRSMSYGYDYNENDILEALSRNPDLIQPGSLRKEPHYFYKSKNIFTETANMIEQNLIVGWFQGKSESGPRALGSRSILAKVNGFNARDVINSKVKNREWFRPFGPSILNSDLEKLGFSENIPSYMTEAIKVKYFSKNKIKNCVHIDNTSRIHSVDENSNQKYFKLLEIVKQRFGYGAVLNTSFNVNEPIVETPSDALSTFLRCNMDALVIGDYIVKKNSYES